MLLLARRPLAAAALAISAFLLEMLLVTPPALELGLLIYPADMVFSLLLLAAVVRYAGGMARLLPGRRIALALLALYLFALGRGFAANGLKLAGVEGRGSFYFLSGILYFSSFRWEAAARRRVVALWLGASLLLTGVAVFRWLATVAGLAIVAQWEGVGASAIRVLNASQAAFLAAGFFASVFLNLSGQGPCWQQKAFYLLGPVALLLQHRTVWVQLLLGVLWLGLQEPRFRRKAIGVLGGMAVLTLLLTWGLFRQRSDVAVESLQNYASDEGTFMWRVAGWQELLFNNPARNSFDDAVGQPFGTGFSRQIDLGIVDSTPHNYYVEAFLRLGWIGLGLLLLLYGGCIRRLQRIPRCWRAAAYPDARFWGLILILQLLYFVTYAPTYDQSILAGIAIAGLPLAAPLPASASLPAAKPTCLPA